MPVEQGEGIAANDFGERERSLNQRQVEIFRRLAQLVAQRDLETGAHSQRIAGYSAGLASASGFRPDQAADIALAAALHDIGKLAIPDAILLKPGPLDPAERQLMRSHAQIGHDVLAGTGAPLLDLAAEIALTHHERFDGHGYPNCLLDDEIPIAGRIVAIADSFDFLTSDRPYHRAISLAQAQQTMLAERGTHFDPALLDSFSENLDSILAGTDRQSSDRAEQTTLLPFCEQKPEGDPTAS